MEGYLRLALLLLGLTIVLFVLYEVWLSRKRQFKPTEITQNFDPHLTDNGAHGVMSDAREPSMMTTDFIPIDEHDDFTVDSVGPVRIKGGFETDDEEIIEQPVVSAAPKPSPKKNLANDLIVLTVAAREGNEFGSYDLLQAIYAAGLEFGDMNIFHYFDSSPAAKKIPLFSLASATEPGEFEIDRIGNYSCRGLTLFSVLSDVPDPQYAFEQMLKAAEQLADDLDGELRAGPLRPWTKEIHQQYLQKVLNFQLKTHA